MKPRIRTRMLASILGLTTLSLVLVGASAVIGVRQVLDSFASRSIENTTLACSSAVSSRVRTVQQILLSLSSANVDLERIDEALVRLRRVNRDFDTVFFLDPSGRLAAQFPVERSSVVDFSERDFFTDPMKNLNAYVHNRPVADFGVSSIVVTTPLAGTSAHDLQRTPQGVLGVAISMDDFFVPLQHLVSGTQGFFFVLEADGGLAYSSREGAPSQAEIDRVRVLSRQEIVRRVVQPFTFLHRGDAWVGAFTPLEHTSWILVVASPLRDFSSTFQEMLATGVFWMSLAMILAIVTSSLLSRRIVRPVLQLTEGARIIGEGGLDHRIEVGQEDELGELAATFNDMTIRLQEQQVDLEKAYRKIAENERVERELEIAREIQQQLLTSKVHSVPGLLISAVSLPAKEVGGDLVDIFPLSGSRLGVVVADVSGKGVPAALYMAMTRIVLRVLAQVEPSPAEVLERANRVLHEGMMRKMFVTLIYGVFSADSRELLYANAGHEPMILYRETSEKATLLTEEESSCLGAWSEVEFGNTVLPLRPGDALVAYTDGVVESANAEGKMFDVRRLLQVVTSLGTRDSTDILDGIRKRIQEFTGNEPQPDDLTLLVLKVRSETG